MILNAAVINKEHSHILLLTCINMGDGLMQEEGIVHRYMSQYANCSGSSVKVINVLISFSEHCITKYARGMVL